MAKITITLDTQERGDIDIIRELKTALGMGTPERTQLDSAELEAKIRAEIEAAETEARAKEEAEAKYKLAKEVSAREKAEEEAKIKAMEEARAKAKAEEAARLAAEAKARAEKEAKEKAAAEAIAKAEAAKKAAEAAAKAAEEAQKAAEVAEEPLEEETLEGDENDGKPEPEIRQKPTDPVEPEKPASETYTIEEVRALLAQKVADHRQEIKNKLTSLGAPNVTNLDPAKYVEFANFLKALD